MLKIVINTRRHGATEYVYDSKRQNIYNKSG